MKLPRLLAVLPAAILLALPAASRAAIREVGSANWAGYAIHHGGVAFKRAQGSWRVSSATCSPGQQTFSATWVGIGGYALSSRALEQVGTETDCSPSGQVAVAAWYELVPAASRTVQLRVRPGDEVTATVAISGRRVRLSLRDRTTRRGFSRTLTARVLDTSSAEWIEEAPSECTPSGACQVLPMANFGQVKFTGATATERNGKRGSISSRRWQRTELVLEPSGTVFITSSHTPLATPTALSSRGHAFAVDYTASSSQPPLFTAHPAAARRLAQPGRAAPSERLAPGGRRR
jgi:hypothetical protein